LQSVPGQTESAFRHMLQSKPATSGPQELTAQEFQSVAGIIRPFDGGNNQYHNMGSLFPKFDVTDAATIDINGKTALLVKGKFWTGGPSGGLSRESIYIPNDQGGVEQISLTAPTMQIQQYEQDFWHTAHSVRWA
ncbi:MAG: hypothetical protein ACRD3W_00610, partial [Terriglobales bacterium]